MTYNIVPDSIEQDDQQNNWSHLPFDSQLFKAAA